MTEQSIATKISDRFWNMPQKADEEMNREQTFIDDIIAKNHIERLLLDNLDGIRTAFDGGAGYGRFSLLLAQKGIHVTHFDISLPMIEKAKLLAEQQGVSDKMTFVHGSLDDLSAFTNEQFDLVMSFDAPISYTYPNQESVIQNLIRIAGKCVCFSVYSRLGWAGYQFDPAQKGKYILDHESSDPLVRWTLDHAVKQVVDFKPNMSNAQAMLKTGLSEPLDQTAADFEVGGVPFPVSYAFMPEELRDLLARFGAKNVRLSGPGALARSVPGAVLRNIMSDEQLKREFLDFCYQYDSNPYVAGLGKDNLVTIADVGREEVP